MIRPLFPGVSWPAPVKTTLGDEQSTMTISRRPLLVFVILWTLITASWLALGLLVGNSPPENAIAALLLIGGAAFGLLQYHFYSRIEKTYKTAVPIEMWLRVRKAEKFTFNDYYVQLRTAPGVTRDADIIMRVFAPEWISALNKDEPVIVYRSKKKDEIVIKTRFGLLWPAGPTSASLIGPKL